MTSAVDAFKLSWERAWRRENPGSMIEAMTGPPGFWGSLKVIDDQAGTRFSARARRRSRVARAVADLGSRGARFSPPDRLIPPARVPSSRGRGGGLFPVRTK